MGNIIRGNKGDIIEIIIRDFSGAKIEEFRCRISDTVQIKKISNLIKSKYLGETDWLSFDEEFFKF